MADDSFALMKSLAMVSLYQRSDIKGVSHSYLAAAKIVVQRMEDPSLRYCRADMAEFGILIASAAVRTSVTHNEFKPAADCFFQILEQVVKSNRLDEYTTDDAFRVLEDVSVKTARFEMPLLPIVELIWAELFERAARTDLSYAIKKADGIMKRHSEGSLLHQLAKREAMELRRPKQPLGKAGLHL